MDSPDQGAAGLPVDAVTFTRDSLRLELRLGASFAGQMSADGRQIAGTWRQGGHELPLTLARGDSLAAPSRPQEPKPPYPYESEEVRYSNAAAGVTLAGTLTRPRGAGPFPCVLLITGSGAEDRDETVFGHRPFLVIADQLTRNGVAVLRVDDRGVGGSTGSTATATTEDFAGDVVAGVRFLAGRKDVDARRIGLVGHSEGGLIAPLAATRASDVAFIVLLASPGVTGEEILLAQGEALVRASGLGDAAVAQQRKVQQGLLSIAKSGADSLTTVARARALFRGLAPEADSAALEPQVQAAVRPILSPWLRFFITYDPRPTLRKVKCPVLAMNGERDLQVLPTQNLPEIAKALEQGGNKQVKTVELAGLNHLFQTCTTGLPSEYASIEETMDPAALDTLTRWIQARTSPGKR